MKNSNCGRVTTTKKPAKRAMRAFKDALSKGQPRSRPGDINYANPTFTPAKERKQ
jgi:hypothetical protein